VDTTTPVDTHPLADTIEPLKIADRCDRCGAQAFVVVQLTSDDSTALMFCGHHYAKHEAALHTLDPFAVRDERHRINAKPDTS
jgi:hypothetical protein